MTRPALHTVAEAVPILRKSKSWIYAAMRDRRIPYTEVGSNKFLSDADIAEILRKGARPAKAKPERRPSETAKQKPQRTAPAPQPARRPRPRGTGPTAIPQADPTASRKYRPPMPAA
ncbi:hypothetical protein [Nonomuraea turcica]|uniref:hypothetical protein n=1 Tax=Nonomuraea sp. G32 TaxID=3067274 RepID=UPI00273BF789|nr:hypothetical protein [Nonomuraea sp. G32]MDP4500999.1 hypothetical protein [Nonomuraea sp. G32]